MAQMFDIKKVTEAIKRKQATIDRNSKKMKTAPKYIYVGWDKSSGTYPEQGGKPVEEVALIHEFGTEHHTAKGMVSNTVFFCEDEWIKRATKLIKKGFKWGRAPDYYDIAEKLGRQIKSDLRDYTYSIGLVDTERLANSVIVKYRRR